MSRIIVKNLPNGITEDRLKRHFGEKGTITDCSLKYTKDGVFRKFAFVGFQKMSEAEAAVKHYNQTFIDMARIQVAICNSLANSDKNRPWSKHSKTALVTPEPATIKTSNKKKQPDKEKKAAFENDLLKDLKNNAEFQEFLEVHKPRSTKSTWVNDIVLPQSAEKDVSDQSGESDEETEEHTSLSMKEETTETDKKPKQKLSDLDYLKSKMTGDIVLSDDSDSDDNHSADESLAVTEPLTADQKPNIKYLIKMKGLPASVKQTQIQDFFKPIVPLNIHIPKNRKSVGIVTVEFASEKDQELALRRNKNYIGPKKIFLHRLNEVVKDCVQESRAAVWEMKKNEVDESTVSQSGELFVRNLAYCCTEEDLKTLFETYGSVEVNLPVDRFTKKIKGFAIVKYSPPENAVKALAELDGSIFQGRMLHILPGKARQETVEITDDMPFKKKKELKQKATSSSSHNWNSLFVGANAVADVMAEKYGKSKDEILTQAGKNDSIGVRMALGETQIVAQIRQFLIDNGVSLDSFSQPTGNRSKTAMLVKHLPAGTTASELQELFERYGTIGRLVLPPGGLTAIVEYIDATEARAGFRSLAYTKFKHVPLYLEWAPVDVFHTPTAVATVEENPSDADAVQKKPEEKETASENDDDGGDSEPGSTLFVKNLNFDTTEDAIKMVFSRIGKIRSVSIARKKDMKKPGGLLSMGYGFVEFKSVSAAKEALKVLQHTMLDGHQLELKVSNRTTLQTDSRQRNKKSTTTKKQNMCTKILIRNIPFEAKASEVKQLFGVFGELKSVRVPKKVGSIATHRGFAFVDFLTKEDAKRAFEALCHSTHLYGRRLVLEWADTEADSLEAIRRKTAQHFVEDSSAGKRLKKSTILDELGTGEDD
jgi:multiple RNA-binding domain-containing protein 1